MLNEIGYYIKNSKDLIYIFLTLLATIFIPFVIYFFQEINKNNKNFKELDLIIFKTKKFNIIELIFWFFFIIFILFFWNSNDKKENFVFIINTAIIFLVVFPLLIIISKIKNISNFDRFLRESSKNKSDIDVRINYVNNYLSIKEKDIYIWNDILKSDFQNDEYFFKNFINILFKKINDNLNKQNKKIESLDKHGEISRIRKLLIDYNNINNSTSLSTFFYIDWNFNTLLELYKNVFNNKENENFIWIDDIFNQIIKQKLENIWINSHYIFSYYKILQEHINKNKTNHKYIKYLLENLLSIYFYSDKILLNRDIVKWFLFKIEIKTFEEYRKNRKITFEYLTQSIILEFILNYIISDIQKHYNDEKIEINEIIDNILGYWFEEFQDLILFSEILFLIFLPHWNNRAECILNWKRTFWYIWKVKTYFWWNEESLNKKVIIRWKIDYENTIINFKKLFPWLINKEDLKKLLIQFDFIIKESKLEKNKILKAKEYIKIINLLQS